MKINNIKKVGTKYKIILDDEIITTYDNVILDNGLLYNKKITQKELNKIKEDTIYYESYNEVLKMINRKLRSEYEIKTYLEKKEFKDTDKVITKLKELNLINDKEYAISYTNDKINLTLDGPYKIKRYLEENNIDEEYINLALDNFNSWLINEKINKIINKKLKTNKDTEYIFKQKLSLYLSNLGYSREDIMNNLDSVKVDNKKLENEMIKIFNKLENKYSGFELKNKLKQKLYSKGFKIEEINEFIEKTVH